MKRSIHSIIFSIFLLAPIFLIQASSLSISPASGTFSVGSTFDISILLDTKGKAINAFQVFLKFPADKLQVISPSVGQSIAGVWTISPKFNNSLVTIDLEGGFPGGITVSSGILTSITFRVKSVGEAIVKFIDKSAVFLDDGLATDDLGQTRNAIYQFRLPPPQGPVVVSETHSDETAWYANANAVLSFASEAIGVEDFSYVLNRDPITVPDSIGEGSRKSVSYTNLADGVHYFHVKSMRDSVWGGTTHFSIKVDTVAPAQFSTNIVPSARTTRTRPIIEFKTTDASSGISHYEIRIEPLSPDAIASRTSLDGGQNFFIETNSPYIPPTLALGSYDVIIRAYDNASNYREVTKRLSVTTFALEFISGKGIEVRNLFVISWTWVWIIGVFLLLILGFGAYKAWKWRHEVHIAHSEKQLPEDVEKQLEELKEYRAKYNPKILGIFLVGLSLNLSLLSFNEVHAQTQEIAPPLISTISKDISNKEIFYVGGKTNIANQTVILYYQNLSTGETNSQSVESGLSGDWFYRHTGFLSTGEYLLWTQSKMGEKLSPPSPEMRMMVKQTALQFGSNRLSYEAIYLFLIILLVVGIIGLSIFITFHLYHGRIKHKKLKKEIREAEESIRRGFAVLRRDIEAELALVRQANLGGALLVQERHIETQLLNDLDIVQKRIGQEIWDIERES